MHSLTLDRSRGLTLLELVIGVALGTMLLIALTSMAQVFTEQVGYVRESTDDPLERALVELADDVRHAWVVEQPTATTLRCSNVFGSHVTYGLSDATLEVQQTNGARGALLDGVASIDVSVETMRRLRDGPPASRYETWYEFAEPGGTAEPVVLEDGLPIALGFTGSTIAPESAHTVEDVDEVVLSLGLERLLLAATWVPPVDDPPGASAASSESGGSPLEGTSSSGSSAHSKATVCHVPPGNPSNASTLSVAPTSVDAHLEHGDSVGPCLVESGSASVTTPTLTVALHEARAPGDPRPHGPALASVSVPAGALPAGGYDWTATSGAGSGNGSSKKVVVCHIPPGNPENMHTLSIAQSAVAAHLKHGDVPGSCEIGETSGTVYVLDLDVPAASAPIDLAPLGAVVRPGRAYTLVLSLAGAGSVVLRGVPVNGAANGTVALDNGTGGGFKKQAMTVPFRLEGTRTVTQTIVHDVITKVTFDVETDDGRRAGTSAVVAGQLAAPNPWLGAVPGEYPALTLSGP